MESPITDADIVNYNICFNLANSKEYEHELKLIFKNINEHFLAIKENAVIAKTETKTVNPLLKLIFEQLKLKRKVLRDIEYIKLKQVEEIVKDLSAKHVEDKFLRLVNYLEYFWQKMEFFKGPHVSLDELEGTNGLLKTLENAIKPNGALIEGLVYLAEKRWPCAKHVKDPLGIHRVQAIYFGYLSFVYQMFFVHEMFALLADFYFQQSDITKFNDYLVILLESCTFYKKQHLKLTEKLNKFINFYETLPTSEVQAEFLKKLSLALKILAGVLVSIELPFALEQPECLQRKPDFTKTNLQVPIGNWKSGQTVSYAIQYEISGNYTKIGVWSRPYYISDKSNPILHLAQCKHNRLVYRTFGQGKAPELVAFLKADGPTSFHDIYCDLFNAAGNLNEELAIQQFRELLKQGNNVIKAAFEHGFSVLHAAAAAGNDNLTKALILKNSYDTDGATNLLVEDKPKTVLRTYNKLVVDKGSVPWQFNLITYTKAVDCEVTDNLSQEFEVVSNEDANTVATIENEAAVTADNVNLKNELATKNSLIDINSKDSDGFTALHIAAQIGYEDFVKLLMENEVNVNVSTKAGQTALHLAAIKGNIAVIKLLLKESFIDWGKSFIDWGKTDQYGFLALHYAVFAGKSTCVAFFKGRMTVNQASIHGLTAVHLAILNNDIELLRFFLNHPQIDINLKADCGKLTALHFAVLCKNAAAVKLLLAQQQLNVNAAAYDGITALHLAIALKADSIAAELLKIAEIDVSAKTKAGIRPLHIAAQTNQHEIAAKLIQKFAEVDAPTKLGYTPLHLAAKFGCAEALATLLENKANYFLDTHDGFSAIMLATYASSRNASVLTQLLVDTTPIDEDFNTGEDTFYWLFPQYANLEAFKHFEEVFKPIEGTDAQTGNDMLHYAVNGKNMAVIEYLIKEKSFDINAKNKQGHTPLHCATKNGSLKVVEYLLENGADVTAEDAYGRRPIFYALQPAQFEILKVILAKVANETPTDKRGANILHYAASLGNLTLVKYLIEENCQCPKARDHAGETPIFYAARKNKIDVVKYLIEKCDINIRHRCHKNRTPLMAAVCHNSLTVLKYLTEAQAADINARDKDKETALHLACHYNFFEIVKYLVTRGANMHARDFCQRTPVLYAAEFADIELLKYLLEHGANINDVNNYRISILHYAALGGNLTNVKYLIEVHNFDVTVKDSSGETPVFYATRLDNLDVIKYFLDVRKLSPFVQNDHKRTLLHNAYYLDIAKYLVKKHNLDINAIDKDHMTPLDAADKETAAFLKSLGAF